ncbi:uncharacterized protein LOC113315251 [Papaver somniferum]|nr:uncharacterized protein LOC113315251 [Papaver somniferum]
MEIQELQNMQPKQKVLNCNQFAIQRAKERMRRSQRERRAKSENKASMAFCLSQQARQRIETEKKVIRPSKEPSMAKCLAQKAAQKARKQREKQEKNGKDP